MKLSKVKLRLWYPELVQFLFLILEIRGSNPDCCLRQLFILISNWQNQRNRGREVAIWKSKNFGSYYKNHSFDFWHLRWFHCNLLLFLQNAINHFHLPLWKFWYKNRIAKRIRVPEKNPKRHWSYFSDKMSKITFRIFSQANLRVFC